MFLNLTNHRAEKWSARQRSAAEELGGEVVDYPFPAVPPDATPEDVAGLGRAMLPLVAAKQPVAILIQGEFTLAFFLVRELQLLGFPCYAATTARVSDITGAGGGKFLRTSEFEFVQFRRYL